MGQGPSFSKNFPKNFKDKLEILSQIIFERHPEIGAQYIYDSQGGLLFGVEKQAGAPKTSQQKFSLHSQQGELLGSWTVHASGPVEVEIERLLISATVELSTSEEKFKHERWHYLGKSGKFVLKSFHPLLSEIYERLENYGKSDSSVLIEGESGTGKEIVAQAIHTKSHRKDKPFVAINCAAIPEALFEAELFGVAKGAATGTAERKGRIELASEGTLFLDEIGELPLSMQAKLLRVLQDRMIQRVGSEDAPLAVDFRVISATNRNLEEFVKLGRFREDLYYRINVVQLRLPPLRERKADIPELCQSFLDRLVKQRGWSAKTISAECMDYLLAFQWPGNIRQLFNKLEGAVIQANQRSQLEKTDFNLASSENTENKKMMPLTQDSVVSAAFDLKKREDQVKAQTIQDALKATQGNKTKAAKLLGISREGLRKALKRAA